MAVVMGTSLGNWTSGFSWAGLAAPTAADDVSADASTGSIMNTMTVDSGAVCRSADFSGWSTPGTLAGSANLTIGDGTAGAGNVVLKFKSGMTLTKTNSIVFVSTSSTVQTITSAGIVWTCGPTFNGAGGSWQLADALDIGTLQITLTAGSFDANDFAVSAGIYSDTGTATRSLDMGNGTWTLTGAGRVNPWVVSSLTGLTFSAGTGKIILNIGASNRTFSTPSDGLTFYNLEVVTGAAGVLTFAGNSSWNKMTATGGSTVSIKFTDGITVTVSGAGTDSFFSGSAGGNVTLNGTSTGGWTLNCTHNLSSDYLTIDYCTVTGGGILYCGTHSTDGGHNDAATVKFTDPPSASRAKYMLMMGVG